MICISLNVLLGLANVLEDSSQSQVIFIIRSPSTQSKIIPSKIGIYANNALVQKSFGAAAAHATYPRLTLQPQSIITQPEQLFLVPAENYHEQSQFFHSPLSLLHHLAPHN